MGIYASIKHLLARHDCAFQAGGEYSIGLYSGAAYDALHAVSVDEYGVTNPIVDRAHVTDRNCRFVADPFLIHSSVSTLISPSTDEAVHYLFFEAQSDQGDIGLASSVDMVHWRYHGIVLDENFHMSYPHVFEHEARFYMLPETNAVGELRLYESLQFPFGWVKSAVLLSGSDFIDSSLLIHSVDSSSLSESIYFYIFTSVQPGDNLRLYVSRTLHGPYLEHPSSPIRSSDSRFSRNAGRIVAADHQSMDGDCVAYRYAMDNRHEYGQSVMPVCITLLTPHDYKERIHTHNQPMLRGSGNKQEWNGNNMHHIDIHRQTEIFAAAAGKKTTKQMKPIDTYIAIVDGCGRMP